jgi:Right handed beta helix region
VTRLGAMALAALLLTGCASGAADRRSPTPTPIPTMTTPPRTGCIHVPSRCGYPDATTAGVVDRARLRRVPQDVTSGTGWTWDSRGWLQVTADGAVVDNLEVDGPIEVTHKNVTVRGNVIHAAGETWGVGLRHTTNATVSGNTIGAVGTSPRLLVGIKDIYGDAAGTAVTANDIAGTSTAIQIGSGLIRDNYIHDLAMASGDHVNGITSNGSSQRLEIDHNTVLNSFDQTDAIGLFQDFGLEANRLITGNLLAGGGYTIYGGGGSFGRTHDIRIVGNRISRLYFPSGGSYGPLAYFDDLGDGNTWSGNVWDEDGSPVASP